MNADTLVSLLAAISVIVAIIAFLRQSQDTRLALGVQLLRDFEKQFDSEGMRRCRVTLSAEFLRRKEGEALPPARFSPNSSLFDFFTMVGVLVKRRVLDLELTWATFSYWLVRYWEAADKEIKAFRELLHEDGAWSECEYLYQQFLKYDSRHQKCRPSKLDESEILRFLKEESELMQVSLTD